MTDKSNASKNTTTSIESLSDMVNELPVRAEELKAKFAAGAVPLEGDYVKLIDAIYSALTALGLDPDNRATGDGLQVNTETGKLEVKTSGAASGLTVTTNGITVDRAVIQPKLTPDSNKGYIKIDGNNTIGIDSLDFGITSGEWVNVVGKGVNTQSINRQHLMVHGQQFTLTSLLNESWGHNCIELKFKPSGGIKTHEDGLEIDTSVIQPKLTAGTGITISGSTISANLQEVDIDVIPAIKMMAAIHGATHYSIHNYYLALYKSIGSAGNRTWQIYLITRLRPGDDGSFIVIPVLKASYSLEDVTIDGQFMQEVSLNKASDFSGCMIVKFPGVYESIEGKVVGIAITMGSLTRLYDSEIYKV